MKISFFLLLMGTFSANAQQTPLAKAENLDCQKTWDSLNRKKKISAALGSLTQKSFHPMPNQLPAQAHLYTLLKKTDLPKNWVAIPNAFSKTTLPKMDLKALEKLKLHP